MEKATLMRYGGYALFFWVCFWLFAYWTFPYERLGGLISEKVQASSDYSIQFGDLSPSWLTGVSLQDVRLRKGGREGEEGELRIPALTARASLFGLLTGSTAMSFSAELEGGSVDGAYEEDEGTRHIEAELDGVDLGALGVLDDVVPLPVKGAVYGDVDLTLKAKANESEGEVELEIRELSVGDGKAKLDVPGMGGLTVDQIEAGDLKVELSVAEGVAQLKTFESDGKDVALAGSGDIKLAPALGRSRADLLVKIKIKDAYKKKSGRAEAIVSMIDSGLSPQVKRAKTSDGALQFRVSGQLSRPRVVPAGRSRPRTGRPRLGRPRKPKGKADD